MKSRLVTSNHAESAFFASPFVGAGRNYHNVIAIFKTLLAIGSICIMFGREEVFADPILAYIDDESIDEYVQSKDGVGHMGADEIPHFTRTESYISNTYRTFYDPPADTPGYTWVTSRPHTVPKTAQSKGTRSYEMIMDTDTSHKYTFMTYVEPSPLPPFIPNSISYSLSFAYWEQVAVQTPEPSTYVLALLGVCCLCH